MVKDGKTGQRFTSEQMLTVSRLHTVTDPVAVPGDQPVLPIHFSVKSCLKIKFMWSFIYNYIYCLFTHLTC